jgi:enoyl-CoA hydratase/carnithine racemase
MPTIDTGTNELLCEIDQRVATITLNRPDKRNSLSDHLTPALRQTLLDLDTDARVGCVVITGAGKAFCAGGDVSGMGSSRSQPDAPRPDFVDSVRNLTHKQETLTLRLWELSKPTIAALPGPAAGAGLSIALACDLRLMADDTFVTTAFGNIGLSGDYGASWFLTRLVGPAIAKELYFSSRRVTSEECLKLGVVNRLAPFEDLQQTTRDLAEQIANGPTTAIRYMKENLNRAIFSDLRTCLGMEADRLIRCSSTDDHKEAVRAFMEKRPPKFHA